jgi:hypothetical protein
MTTMATKTGRDGKLYPAVQPGGALPLAERAEVIRLTHLYRCTMGLRYADIVTALAEGGHRRSVGSIYADIQRFQCQDCADGLPEPGVHVTEAASGAW